GVETMEFGAEGDPGEMTRLDEPEVRTLPQQDVLDLEVGAGSGGPDEVLGRQAAGLIDTWVLIAGSGGEGNGHDVGGNIDPLDADGRVWAIPEMGEGEVKFPALVYSVDPGISLHELELEVDPHLTELVPEQFGQLGKSRVIHDGEGEAHTGGTAGV